jgi:hypothetical protein
MPVDIQHVPPEVLSRKTTWPFGVVSFASEAGLVYWPLNPGFKPCNLSLRSPNQRANRCTTRAQQLGYYNATHRLLVITLRPQTPRHIRGGWSIILTPANQLMLMGLKIIMVTVQSGFEPATFLSLAHELTNCSNRAHKHRLALSWCIYIRAPHCELLITALRPGKSRKSQWQWGHSGTASDDRGENDRAVCRATCWTGQLVRPWGDLWRSGLFIYLFIYLFIHLFIYYFLLHVPCQYKTCFSSIDQEKVKWTL